MMWVREDKIEKVWPLTCDSASRIRRTSASSKTLGTRSFPLEQGIGEAINFHEGIGSQRASRSASVYLKNYWATRVQSIPKVKLHTSLNPEYSCAICGVFIDGMTPGQVSGALFDKYKIHTVGIVWENISCVRVTPHVYTTLTDLDKLVGAIGEISQA